MKKTNNSQQWSEITKPEEKKINKLIICVIYGCVEIDLWTRLVYLAEIFLHKTSVAQTMLPCGMHRAGAVFFCYSSFANINAK